MSGSEELLNAAVWEALVTGLAVYGLVMFTSAVLDTLLLVVFGQRYALAMHRLVLALGLALRVGAPRPAVPPPVPPPVPNAQRDEHVR